MQPGHFAVESAGVSGCMFYVWVNLTFADLTLAYTSSKSFAPHLRICESYTLSWSFIKYNCFAINPPSYPKPLPSTISINNSTQKQDQPIHYLSDYYVFKNSLFQSQLTEVPITQWYNSGNCGGLEQCVGCSVASVSKLSVDLLLFCGSSFVDLWKLFIWSSHENIRAILQVYLAMAKYVCLFLNTATGYGVEYTNILKISSESELMTRKCFEIAFVNSYLHSRQRATLGFLSWCSSFVTSSSLTLSICCLQCSRFMWAIFLRTAACWSWMTWTEAVKLWPKPKQSAEGHHKPMTRVKTWLHRVWDLLWQDLRLICACESKFWLHFSQQRLETRLRYVPLVFLEEGMTHIALFDLHN